MIDAAVLDRHGLKRDEYDRIVAFLGREPNLTELGIFSVMWSEHCSYKSSRVHLRTLPTEGPQVLQGPGENAGAVDIGEGLAAVFKIESHNHPSFIEPYQGAATGVGGIIRDIFTMGARPIALMNSLRFGSLDAPGTPRLLEGVVAGIAGYGNSIGVPTVGGEIAFEPSYAGNPLVNVFCLGIARAADIIKGVASGVGNAVYYVGAKTGRDGIHGATMASAEFDEKSAEKRPAVQVGDPFMEKLLLEACLEVMQTDALVGIQDMGAAGLTCSTTEMGSRGGAGIEIDVVHVPQRETGMTPYEIMLSESQERMLLVVKRGREAEVERIFEKWDLHAVHIGEVTDDGILRVKHRGTIVAEIPNRALTDEAPVYRRPMEMPGYLADVQRLDLDQLPAAPAATDALRKLAGSPTIASKRWVYTQYDHMVQTNTINLPGLGAGVVRIKGTARALAMSVDGNGRYCYLDPRRGAMLAVAEAARNVACAGARPLGATNCLNFGNPERPSIMWQFAQAVEGIGEACRALAIPITGGNVSLYNETDGKAIYPTPTIGVVGLLEHADRVLTGRFQRSGAAIILLGSGRGELGGSEYLKVVYDRVSGVPPQLDLESERALQELVAALAADRLVESANDCSDGGLAMALAECCFGAGDRGADVAIDAVSVARNSPVNQAAALFGESASRVLVSAAADRASDVLARALAKGVPAQVIGQTGGHQLRVSVGGKLAIDVPVGELERIWTSAIERYFIRRVA
jgi:phosphoribosylformylglycinamidine synthase subunit PurL